MTPHKLAVLCEGRTVSYAELDRLADGLAAGMIRQGVQPGDRVAVNLPNSIEYVALIHAVARIGAVLVPLNTRLTDQELAIQIDLTTPRLIINDPVSLRYASHSVQAIRPETAPVYSTYGAPDPESPLPNPHSPQSIIFTSGTSGTPKGAVLTFDNHLWSATSSAMRLGVDVNDRWLSCLPLYHVGGQAVVFRSCLYGTAILLHSRFDVDAFNAALDTDRPTLTSLVPTMLHRLLQRRTQPWPASLRMVLLGGAAATPELLDAAKAANVPVATTYGLTEAASQVTTALPGDVLRKPGSVGKPLIFTEVHIVDDQQIPLFADEIGEILVRGPQVMMGYFENPDATAHTLRNGWLHTGDLGYVDADGDLFLVQRRSDLIVSGGENVYPVEVETALRRHPAVAEACVVGIPDPEWGQRVVAAVELHPGATATPEALLTFCREKLAGYKVPRRLRILDALPQTASGKIERRAVAELMTKPAQVE